MLRSVMRIPVLGAVLALLVVGALAIPQAHAVGVNAVSGVLRDDEGTPVVAGGFVVALIDQATGEVGRETLDPGDADFSFDGLPDGSYLVHVVDENGRYVSVLSDEFTLTGGQSRTVDLVVVLAGSLEITVRGPGGGELPETESGWVEIARTAPEGSGQAWVPSGLRPVNEPLVVFDLLTPGTYLARYTSEEHGAMSAPFAVTAGDAPASIELSLERLGVVRGSVELPAGVPASTYADISVELHSDVWEGFSAMTVGSTGGYAIKTLANDPVAVLFTSGSGAVADAYWNGSRVGTQARVDAGRVSVAPGGTATRDITLRRAGAHGLPLIESTASPAITGHKRVGEVLTVSTGSWNVAGVTASYQWYRDGKPIVGARGPRHRVGVSDRKARLHASVTVRRTGYDANRADAAKVGPFAKALSRLSVRVRPRPHGRVATVAVRVGAPVPAGALGGKVTVRRGGTVLRSVRLSHGRAGFTVRGLTKGTHSYRVTYSGNGVVEPSTRRVRITAA